MSGSRSLICTTQGGASVKSCASSDGHRRRSRGSCAATRVAGGGYLPFQAHRLATARRGRFHPRRVESNAELRELIAELVMQRSSPQQINRHLRRRFPISTRNWLCHESIYQAVHQPGSLLMRLSPLAPHRRSPLRTGRDHRRDQRRVERHRPRFEQPMLSIHERPFAPRIAPRLAG